MKRGIFNESTYCTQPERRVPLALGWNLSAGDRGKLDGMAPALGMKVLPVSPADAGKTVAQLLGEVEAKAPGPWCWSRGLTARSGAGQLQGQGRGHPAGPDEAGAGKHPPQGRGDPPNRSWVFGDLLAHLQEEHTTFTAAKENQTR